MTLDIAMGGSTNTVLHLLAIAQLWLYDRVGFTVGLGDNYCSASPELGWQGFGGMIVMVLWGLWMARDHLGDVFRKAIKDDPDVDDSRELLSYRSAVVAGVVALLYMVVFLHATGMTPDVIVVFLKFLRRSSRWYRPR